MVYAMKLQLDLMATWPFLPLDQQINVAQKGQLMK